MEDTVKIPVFPLSIFPLPGELVPLHIFELRYKQLLHDVETKDISFGIFFNHVMNKEKIGSLVKLESIIKRFPNGESDIIVRCVELFHLTKMYRTFRDKPYPGGDISLLNSHTEFPVEADLHQAFKGYLRQLNITHESVPTYFSIANELNLDLEERLRFVKQNIEQKNLFLQAHIRYQCHLLHEADKAKDFYHLN